MHSTGAVGGFVHNLSVIQECLSLRREKAKLDDLTVIYTVHHGAVTVTDITKQQHIHIGLNKTLQF